MSGNGGLPEAQIAASLDLPIFTKVAQACGAGIDHFMNNIVIGKLGNMLDACTDKLRNMETSTPVIDVAAISDKISSMGKGDSGPDVTPQLSPSRGGDEIVKARAPEISMPSTPELGKVAAQARSCIASAHDCEPFAFEQAGPSHTPTMMHQASLGMGGRSA